MRTAVESSESGSPSPEVCGHNTSRVGSAQSEEEEEEVANHSEMTFTHLYAH